jgi:3-oxoacyl-(acyl-carrier-protein) synthase
VPGTLNYIEPDPEIPLNVFPESRAMTVRHAMSNNIGLGGHNAAVIFKRYDGD